MKGKQLPVFMSSKTPKPKRDKLITVKNLTDQSADLYIYGEIVDNTDWKWDESDVMPDDVLKVLNQVDGLNNLNIYVNSPGGSVFAGLAIYNILKRNKAQKTVYVDGVAASIASVIALAGDRIMIPSNAFLMIHKPWTIAMGDSNFFRKVADDMDKIESGVMNVYKDNLKEGVELETIQQMVDDETWLSGEEAAKYFNVEVIESKSIAACASEFLNRYNKTPNKLVSKEPPTDPPELQIDEEENLKWQNELDLLVL
jgi:ATP-dependent Clp protease protease subunit